MSNGLPRRFHVLERTLTQPHARITLNSIQVLGHFRLPECPWNVYQTPNFF